MVLGLAVLVVAIPLVVFGGSAQHGQGGSLPLPRGAIWLALGLALHLIWIYGISRSANVPSLVTWLPLAADVPIVIFAFANRRVPGVPVVAVGLALNMLAMAANGGLMPITLAHVPGPHTASRFAGDRLRLSADRVVGSDAPLGFLGDDIAIGWPGSVGMALSVGDIVIVAGCIFAAVSLLRLETGR